MKVGTVLLDSSLDPPWNLLVVVEKVDETRVKTKRPYTHPGKSYILFEDAVYTLPNTKLTKQRD